MQDPSRWFGAGVLNTKKADRSRYLVDLYGRGTKMGGGESGLRAFDVIQGATQAMAAPAMVMMDPGVFSMRDYAGWSADGIRKIMGQSDDYRMSGGRGRFRRLTRRRCATWPAQRKRRRMATATSKGATRRRTRLRTACRR